MGEKGQQSGHLMLITPERVFYAGLLGRPRQRGSGAFHVYVAIEGGLRLSVEGACESYGELAVVQPDVRHTIASDYRSVICVLIEPETVGAGALDALAKRVSGEERRFFANRIRAAYEQLLHEPCGGDIGSSAFDVMCFGEALPKRSLDPRVVGAIAQIGRFCGEPVTAESCAAEAGLSASRFLHLFKQETGISFRAFRAWKRARHLVAFRQSGPQPGASGAGHRLSRFHAFQPFDPPVLRVETARDFFGLPRSRDLSQQPGRVGR